MQWTTADLAEYQKHSSRSAWPRNEPYRNQALFCVDSTVGAIRIHVPTSSYGMTKCPVISAAGRQSCGPHARLKVKKPDTVHLWASCIDIVRTWIICLKLCCHVGEGQFLQ